MNDTFFSVVVPIFNAATTIEAAVASVLGQTEGRFEILLIDDGSNDDSLKVAMGLSKADERVRVIATSNRSSAQSELAASRATSTRGS